MRVLAYNILEGGDLREGDRTAHIVELIQAFDPDVLGVAECTGWERDATRRFEMFRGALGMDGLMNRAISGHNVALLHKPTLPILTLEASSAAMYHGLVRLQVDHAALGALTILMTHLHPYSSLYRTAEAQTLVGKARATQEALVMGDFNTVPTAEVTTALRGAPEHLRTRLLGPGGDFDAAPLAVLEAHGLVDLGASSMQPTYPTRLGGKLARYGAMVRLDFMFATPGLAARCQQFFTIDGDAAHAASDHLPIGCVFD
jgi:endonuclease/exonuclease/phosphatase family metal-dependent hydrolase